MAPQGRAYIALKAPGTVTQQCAGQILQLSLSGKPQKLKCPSGILTFSTDISKSTVS